MSLKQVVVLLLAVACAGCISQSHIEYVRDPRTNVCFAKSRVNGGFSLATVPCTSVPEFMLKDLE